MNPFSALKHLGAARLRSGPRGDHTLAVLAAFGVSAKTIATRRQEMAS